MTPINSTQQRVSERIELEHVSKVYGDGSRISGKPILNDITENIEAGERVALVGRSGTGKSTLLRLIGGLEAPTSGQILVGGMSASEARRRRWFGFIPQEPVLLPWRTVLENVCVPGEILRDKKVIEGASQFVEMVGLSAYMNAFPHELSGGMRSRVSIARALSFHPRVLLADEPGADLDEISRETITDDLIRLSGATGATLVVVTHSIEEACYMADRVLVLEENSRTLCSFEVPLSQAREKGDRYRPEVIALGSELRRVLSGQERNAPEGAIH